MSYYYIITLFNQVNDCRSSCLYKFQLLLRVIAQGVSAQGNY